MFLPLIQSLEAAIRDIEGFATSEGNRDRERVKDIEAVVQKAEASPPISLHWTGWPEGDLAFEDGARRRA